MTATPNANTGKRLPVVVLTGFLGSGKTTLLNRLVAHPDMGETAVIINEFGEIGLDHLLVEMPDDGTILLNNGCVCCTMLGDLVETIEQLLMKRAAGTVPPFERIVIETTGLADPGPIAATLMADTPVTATLVLDAIVTVVDAVNGPTQLDRHGESVRQVAAADRIVLSKTDLATAEEREATVARLATINPGAPVRAVVHGALAPGDLLGACFAAGALNAAALESWLGGPRPRPVAEHHGHGHGHGHDHGHGHHHHLDDRIRSVSFVIDDPVHPDGLTLWLNALAALRGASLLRVKGIVNVDGEPVVVHAVQQVFHDPQWLDRWPDDDRRSRIVFITDGLERAAIESTLHALRFRPAVTERDRRLPLDPANYAAFVAAMQGMAAIADRR